MANNKREQFNQQVMNSYEQFKTDILKDSRGKEEVFEWAFSIAKMQSIKDYLVERDDEKVECLYKFQTSVLFDLFNFELDYDTPQRTTTDDLDEMVVQFLIQKSKEEITKNAQRWNPLGENQYIRKESEPDHFEMIQLLYLDAVTEEEKKTQYVILREDTRLSDYTDEQKNEYLSGYGVQIGDEDANEWQIAEAILEDIIINDSCVIAEFANEEEALKSLKEIVTEDNN